MRKGDLSTASCDHVTELQGCLHSCDMVHNKHWRQLVHEGGKHLHQLLVPQVHGEAGKLQRIQGLVSERATEANADSTISEQC